MEYKNHQVVELHVLPAGNFPNNKDLKVLAYKALKDFDTYTPQFFENQFKKNNWKNSWRDGIYDYHHYHSNTHEVLGIYEGEATVQLGGYEGEKMQLSKGDVLVIPAGVAHKNLGSTQNFACVGAYPDGLRFDMNYGKEENIVEATHRIEKVEMPSHDPLYGAKGPLLEAWK